MAAERHPGWRLAAFATPAIPLSAMLLPITIYLPNYYEKDLGVSLTAIALAGFLVRIFDLGLDPLLGFAIDRTRTPFGRFRPWVVAGAPLTMVAIYMLFMAKPGVGVVYLTVWMLAAYAGQSFASLATYAWSAHAAPDYNERSRIYGWWQLFTVIGMLLILTLPVIAGRLGASEAAGVQAMGWFVIAAIPITVTLALMSMREPVVKVTTHAIGWGHYWGMIKQPSVLRVLIVDILMGTAPTVAGTLLFFYFEAVRGYGRPETSALLLVYFVGALAGAPIWTALARRIGKHRALAIAAVFYAAAQAFTLISPHGQVASIIVMFIAGLPFSAGSILLKAMMADVGDEVRLRTGVDLSGMLFSLLTGSIKIGTSIAVTLSLLLLGSVGFQSKLGAGNSPEALMTLSVMFALFPAALGLIAAWLIHGHKLDQAAHALVRAELDALETGPTGGLDLSPAFVKSSPVDVAEDPPVGRM